jgi:Domain of unknown function (DUF4148)
MNTFKLKFALAAATMALGLGTINTALAQDGAASASAKPLTRAEVLADLQVWRESGLARFQGIDDPSVCFMPEYLAAQERYNGMRASPQFALIVARYAGQGGEAFSTAASR